MLRAFQVDDPAGTDVGPEDRRGLLLEPLGADATPDQGVGTLAELLGSDLGQLTKGRDRHPVSVALPLAVAALPAPASLQAQLCDLLAFAVVVDLRSFLRKELRVRIPPPAPA